MTRTILIDTRQQAGKHVHKDEWWDAHGVATERRKLSFGDYAVDGSNVAVDSKQRIAEVARNACSADHARFARECDKARAAGYRLVVLVENDEGVSELADLVRWTNTHCVHCAYRCRELCDPSSTSVNCRRHRTRKPPQGVTVMRALRTMELHHGVRFEFCRPEDSARRICELLGVDYE